MILTSDNLSKLANKALRVLTSSGADIFEDIAVKPTMSANNMLNKIENKRYFLYKNMKDSLCSYYSPQ